MTKHSHIIKNGNYIPKQMLLYSGYLIVLIIDATLIFPLLSPRPLRSSLHLPLSTCVATHPQLSSQQSPCQCEIEMWGNFSRPGLSTHPARRPPPGCIHLLIVEIKCFGMKLLGAAAANSSSQNPECPPTHTRHQPCPPSLPPLDTRSP